MWNLNYKPQHNCERSWQQVTAAWNRRERTKLSVSSVKQIGEATIRKMKKLLASELEDYNDTHK